MKIMTVAGTRPELIKLSEIIKKLDEHTDHVFVHTGQNYDPQLSDVFYKDLGLRKPNVQLVWHGNDLGAQLASNFFDISKVLTDEKPDAVVILGDTNSAIGAGYLTKRMKIPLFHLEAGNRCFDQNVPEEINRTIMDHISDVNLVYSENSRRNLLGEGIAPDRIFLMGSPMFEIIINHGIEIDSSEILDTLGLEKEGYYLVSLHRDENTEIQENLDILVDTINTIAQKYEKKIIFSTHPRLRNKITDQNIIFDPNVILSKPFGFFDYCKLQSEAECVISDSGTIAEESAILQFPAITIRNAIERPEAIDAGSILMSGVNKENILNCLSLITTPLDVPEAYQIFNCSERVLRVILGYTPYINKYVWHK